ncbi:MAG: hypothetical protein HOV79_10860 [Hamadaea sp.]|nr:hypothetical protein [Hamadaea sp.]
MSLRRLCASALALAMAVVAIGSPAAADVPSPPIIGLPGAGWSGEWKFTGANAWQYSITMPGASVTGTGWDTSDVRMFSGMLTDTSPEADRCAVLTFEETAGYQTFVACDGSVYFSHNDPTPAQYTFTLVLRNIVDAHYFSATARLKVPSTKYLPELRANNVGGKWSFASTSHGEYRIVRPGVIVQGEMHGWDYRSADATTSAFSTCARTSLEDGDWTRAEGEVCNGSVEIAATVTISRDFEVRSCLLTARAGTETKCFGLLIP